PVDPVESPFADIDAESALSGEIINISSLNSDIDSSESIEFSDTVSFYQNSFEFPGGEGDEIVYVSDELLLGIPTSGLRDMTLYQYGFGEGTISESDVADKTFYVLADDDEQGYESKPVLIEYTFNADYTGSVSESDSSWPITWSVVDDSLVINTDIEGSFEEGDWIFFPSDINNADFFLLVEDNDNGDVLPVLFGKSEPKVSAIYDYWLSLQL
ncbi:hypothetical protein, partial [Vibrio breoganii]